MESHYQMTIDTPVTAAAAVKANIDPDHTTAINTVDAQNSLLSRNLRWKAPALLLLLLLALYIFLVGLKLMELSFKTLGGCNASALFDFVNNPIAGLMVGILTTILVQSSSTTSSIVVALVGSGTMSVSNAIPVIMGANVGTSVTSTFVAMGQISDLDQFQRAFAAATLHGTSSSFHDTLLLCYSSGHERAHVVYVDVFNLLSVLILLPLEMLAHPLLALSQAWTTSSASSSSKSSEWKNRNPLSAIVQPVVSELLELNHTRVVESESLNNVSNDACDGSVLEGGIFFTAGWSDTAAGLTCLLLSLVAVISALVMLVRVLNLALATRARSCLSALAQRQDTTHSSFRLCHSFDIIRRDVALLLAGATLTFVVQSSSIVTSVLTPLAGVNVVSLEHVFPLVLGANVGTCGTALIAASVSGQRPALQIAIVHLLFNLEGLVLWYPIPWCRHWPIAGARALGKYAARYPKVFPLVYLVSVFILCPTACLGLSVGWTQAPVLTTVLVLVISLVISLVSVVVKRSRSRRLTQSDCSTLVV